MLDTNHLPCGPSNKSSNWDVQDDYISDDYQPLVALPTKLKQLVPAWSSCYGNAFQGQDPPRTLSPATIQVPQLAIVDDYPQPTPASPSPPIPPLPIKTGVGVTQSPVRQVIGNYPRASSSSAADPQAANPQAANPPDFSPIIPQNPRANNTFAYRRGTKSDHHQ